MSEVQFYMYQQERQNLISLYLNQRAVTLLALFLYPRTKSFKSESKIDIFLDMK